MPSFRFASTVVLLASLTVSVGPVDSAPATPIGILTQAHGAYLDNVSAFVGVSVFEGERLQTDAGGHVSLRVGNSSLALAANSEAALIRIANGIHVDLLSGTTRFSVVDGGTVEIHAEEATVRTQTGQATDATVAIVEPKVLQIDARRGSLKFSYREEFRNLPQGQIYRIYLDSPERSETEASGGASPGGAAGRKVAYYILAAGAGSAITWVTYSAIHSGNEPISPAKP